MAIVLVGSSCVPANADEAPTGKAAEKPPDELSPEDVARRFFAALLTRDQYGIKRYSIPAPGEEILWQGAPLSDEVKAAAKERTAAMKFRRLKPGDELTGPDGKHYTIDQRQVNENRVLLLPDGFQLPFTLVHSDLGWRVKIDGLIAARRRTADEEKKPAAP